MASAWVSSMASAWSTSWLYAELGAVGSLDVEAASSTVNNNNNNLVYIATSKNYVVYISSSNVTLKGCCTSFCFTKDEQNGV